MGTCYQIIIKPINVNSAKNGLQVEGKKEREKDGWLDGWVDG